MSTKAAWGSCPECKATITPELASCKGCGFPLKAKPAPPPAPPAAATPARSTTRTRKHRRGGRGKPILEPGEEPPSAMLFAVFGLIVQILAFIGLAQSKRGSGAYLLSWIGIGLWIVGALLIASGVLSRAA